MKLKVLMVVGDLASEENPSFQPFVKSQIDSIKQLGHDVQIFNIHGPNFGGNYILKTIPLFIFARKFKPDIVHSHYSYCSFTALTTLPCPQVISLMGDDILGDFDKTGKKTIRSFFHSPIPWITSKFARHLIVKSPHMIPNFSNKPVTVIPNGVNFQTFFPIDKCEARKSLNIEQDKKLILFPAHKDEINKRYPLALEACKILEEKYSIKNELLCVRSLTQQQFNLYLNACDSLIFTSFSEGSPNAIKEAMAANTPIVSVAVGDTKEVIYNAQNCHIVTPDAFELAEKLFLNIKDGRRSNGRDLICHLEISKIAKKLESVYYNILESTKRGKNEK